MLGPCAGGAAYSPALTDFVIMARATSSMFITGPDVIKAVTGEDVTARDLGGSLVHNSRSGVAQLLAESEGQALELVKLLLSYLPQNNTEDPPQLRPHDPPDRMNDSLNTVIPADESEPYDMHAVLDAVFDRDSFLEIHPYYARNCDRGLRPARRLVRSGSWPTSRPTSRAPSTSTPRTRSRATCASATPSTSRW